MKQVIEISNMTTFGEIMKDILEQDNIIFSVRSGSAVCEARTEQGLPFRIREQWATIGDETKFWHIHVNIEETVEAKFVKENKSESGKVSFSIRFYDTNGNLTLRANFVKMYDSSNMIIQERVSKYEEIFSKYGHRDKLLLENSVKKP
jgi:hypothetical protein